jgi:hypothetical protein
MIGKIHLINVVVFSPLGSLLKGGIGLWNRIPGPPNDKGLKPVQKKFMTIFHNFFKVHSLRGWISCGKFMHIGVNSSSFSYIGRGH